MKKAAIITMALMFVCCLATGVFAGAKEDAMAKCKEAAEMIKGKGVDAATAEINKKDGKFVTKTTYVFLMNMKGEMLGHPIKPSLIGKNLAETPDKTGKKFFKDFITTAQKDGKGWVDYMWPKPGENEPSKKTSYILKVDDNLFVGAGYYP